MKYSKNILVALGNCFGFLASQAFHELVQISFPGLFYFVQFSWATYCLPINPHTPYPSYIKCYLLSETLSDLFIQKQCLSLSYSTSFYIIYMVLYLI